MAEYFTVDSGTTNTRISLVRDYKIIDTLKYGVGANQGINCKELIKNTLKCGINELAKRHKTNVKRILASGMITSEFGLVNLPHITVPAGIGELHSTMYETVIKDISDIPFVFVRGVKTDGGELENSDMMRGEETELMGIFSGEGVYILPGSHSKIIKVDRNGRIVDFKTMLTGEMISSLSENTILKEAVDLGTQNINKEYLIKGFEYSDNYGINEALFKVRILKNLFYKNPEEIYGFFMGVILCDEIKYILSHNPQKIFIGGKTVIKEPEAVLLKAFSEAETVVVPNDAENASALGIINIYEYF